jgi:DNA-binding NarL/FixJ family response regulator
MNNRLTMVLTGQLLARPNNLLAAVTTEAEALEALQRHQANLLICENRLESGCAIKLCRAARDLIPEIRIFVIINEKASDSNWAQLSSMADLAIAAEDVGDPEFPLVRAFIELARGRTYWSPSLGDEKLGQKLSREQNDGLSPREQQVLELLSQGLTDREIACQMGLTHNTARSYVRDLRQKLNKPSRTALSAWFWNQTEKRP